MRPFAPALILAFATACTADISSPVAVHNVSLSATVAGRGPAGDTVHLHITNSGPGSAYLAQCGTAPLILTQQFIGDQWTGGVQNFMCPYSLTGPLVLAAGMSIDIVRVFDTAGRYRFLLSVASSGGFTDAQQARSNAFDVP